MTDREKAIWGLECCMRENNTNMCGDCPYHDSSETRFGCMRSAMRDALALLKEQDPRVLALEDVRRDHDRVLWIECDDSKTQNMGKYRGQVCWHDGHIGKWDRFVVIGFASDYLHRETDKYGKTWRCWNARPTEDQMRDTPWEGENDATN